MRHGRVFSSEDQVLFDKPDLNVPLHQIEDQLRRVCGDADRLSISTLVIENDHSLTFTDRAGKRPLDGYYETPAEGLIVLRSDRTLAPIHRISKPALWISVRGSKWAVVGEQRFDYSAGEALLITVEIPCRCTIPKATLREPFLGWSSN